MEEEIWKDIEGYEGYYKISSLGRIMSLPRRAGCRGGKTRNVNLTFKTPTITRIGYAVNTLTKDGIIKLHQIHRLVAIAFIENPENKPEVNHINCIKADNRLSNLEWVTSSENSIHAIKNNRQSSRHRSENFRKVAMIKDGEVIKIYAATSYLTKDGFDRRAIYQCIKGQNRRKTHKGYEWKFLD